MKKEIYRPFVFVIVMVFATLGLAAAAKSPKSAVDYVPRFLGQSESTGLSWQEGEFLYFDLIAQVCKGGI